MKRRAARKRSRRAVMTSYLSRARTLATSGRRVFWVLPIMLGGVVWAACTTVGSDIGGSGSAELLDPPIQLTERGGVDDPEARRILARASDALASDPLLAMRLARQVVDDHAEAVGSGRALRILAEGAYRTGRFTEAEGWVDRYATLLPPGDDRVVNMHILAGDAALADRRAADAITRWLKIPADADAKLLGAAVARIEEAAPLLTAGELARLTSSAPADSPLAAPLADLLARTAGFAPRLGVVLPTTGSPRLRDFADEIQEGIQVAAAEFGSSEEGRGSVELITRDNRGEVGAGERIIDDLEREGVLGIIGPLQDVALEEVARVRSGRLAIVSPTSPTLPEASPSVYSLQGAEDGASRALAEYAADRGIVTAVIVFPDVPKAVFEAEAFRAAFESLGGQVLATIGYAPGTTYFKEPMRAAASLDPEVLVLPIPARDVELVAPQVTFFGLDSLGIEVLGTGGWTDRSVLGRVDSRHTNGVVAASSQPAQGDPGREGSRAFREAYERFFSNSLRSTVPAYGYDAARLLLEAVRRGARTAGQVATVLEGIQGFEGATGRLSIRDGRVTREHYLVCIQDQQLQDLNPEERPVWTLMPPLRDPETDSIPKGVPPRIVGYRCPGAPLPPGALPDSIFHPDSAYILPDTIPPDTTSTPRDNPAFRQRSRRR
jgi:branched-chain amino acid transport system substrate-binding protein